MTVVVITRTASDLVRLRSLSLDGIDDLSELWSATVCEARVERNQIHVCTRRNGWVLPEVYRLWALELREL